MATIEDAYRAAKSFDDLCRINVQFLNGTYDHTAYHCGPVDDETIPLLDDLCLVNSLGFYTYSGQPSDCDMEQSCKSPCIWKCWQSRGYLNGFIDNKYIDDLRYYLDYKKESNGVYYSIEYSDLTYENTIPFQTYTYPNGKKSKLYKTHRISWISASGFTMTEDDVKKNICHNVTNWEYPGVGAHLSEYSCEHNELIDLHIDCGVDTTIFKNCASVQLVTRDFDSSLSLEKLIIDFFVSHS